MKKYYIFFGITLLFYFFYPTRKYVELNHLSIIREIHLSCKKNYQLTLKEIIPEKKDNGIHYQYKNYSFSANSFSSLKKKIQKSGKNYYFNHVNLIKTNCSKYKDFTSMFSIPLKNVKVKDLP